LREKFPTVGHAELAPQTGIIAVNACLADSESRH
jgi:hypothetical protein